MKMKRLAYFILSVLMLLCVFAIYPEKAFAAVDHTAVIDKILAGDGAAGDAFGRSVAISGDKVVVGAFKDDDKGSVYVYDLSYGDGTLSDVLASELKLTASDGAANDLFGFSVAISGDKVVVGAYWDDDNGSDSGSVYIYDLSAADVPGSELKLIATGGAEEDIFGYSVAISGDKVVVGAVYDDDKGSNSGSVYIYDLSNGTGSLSDVLDSQLNLTASDGAPSDYFGVSVAISGNKVVVGAYQDDDKGTCSGSVYIYNLSDASELKLTANDGAEWDYYGASVAISGDNVVVGSDHDDDMGSKSGSVYIYDLLAADVPGSQLKLTADDGSMADYFGCSVAISGEKVVVGADGDRSDTGSAYIYDLSEADVPASEQKLTASDGAQDDRFGRSVAISGDKVIVGAHRDDDNGSDSGSVYTHIGKYNVTLDMQGGTGVDSSVIVLYNDQMPVKNAPTLKGYTFDGYYLAIDGGGKKYYNADMTSANNWVSGESTLYANWIANNYTVAFDGNGNDSGSMSDQSFTYDTAQELTVNGYTKKGYTFAGWANSADGTVVYTDEESVSNLTDVSGDTVTLYAKWTAGTYTATLNQQGGTNGDYSVTTTYNSAMPTASAPTRDGYTFEGYFTATNGSGEQYYNADMTSAKNWDIDSDAVLYAHWTESNPLAIDTSDLPAGTLGESYSCTVTASGGDGSNSWYASGLPVGLSMERDTGKISGKPNETGTFSVNVRVYDGEHRKATKAYSLTVSSPSATGKYEIVPDTDSAYTMSTVDGFTTLTIKSGIIGFRYIKASVNPVITHEGEETVVFVHVRDGVQIGFCFAISDFDLVNKTGMGFNIQPGDTIKIYVVDKLSNDPGVNPVLLQ